MKEIKKAKKDAWKKIKSSLKYDEEGRGVVDIKIKNSKDVISDYSDESNATINNEFSNYLTNKVKVYPPKTNLHLKFDCKNDLTDKDKEKISLAIKNHYENEFIENELFLKKNTIISIIMLCVSIVLLGISFVLSLAPVSIILVELFEIAGWVFAWECVDLLSFRRTKIVFSQRRQFALMKCKISFNKPIIKKPLTKTNSKKISSLKDSSQTKNFKSKYFDYYDDVKSHTNKIVDW